MKIVSLFTKAPGYKRFSYEPRFWDQKAEERKEREERIRREIELERGQTEGDSADLQKRMRNSFRAARKGSQTSKSNLNTALVRLAVLLFLSLFILAFLNYGKVAFYSLLVFVPVYFYFKFKNNIPQK